MPRCHQAVVEMPRLVSVLPCNGLGTIRDTWLRLICISVQGVWPLHASGCASHSVLGLCGDVSLVRVRMRGLLVIII